MTKHELLLAILCFCIFTACSSEKASEKKEDILHDKATSVYSFVACHPEKGDMSPDGAIFVALSPGAPVLNILKIEKEQQQTQLILPRLAEDVVMVSADQALLSYGSTGEVAIADLKMEKVGAPVKVGMNIQGICRAPGNQVVIADAEARQLYLYDLTTEKVVKSFAVGGNPTQMRWVTEGVELETANAQGKVLGKINLSQTSAATAAAKQ